MLKQVVNYHFKRGISNQKYFLIIFLVKKLLTFLFSFSMFFLSFRITKFILKYKNYSNFLSYCQSLTKIKSRKKMKEKFKATRQEILSSIFSNKNFVNFSLTVQFTSEVSFVLLFCSYPIKISCISLYFISKSLLQSNELEVFSKKIFWKSL